MTDQEALISSFDSVSATSLQRRSSEKWKRYPPEVLPAFIAEMDFPVAEVILKAIRGHLENGADLGYPFVYSYGNPLQCAFTKWALASFSWAVDPKDVLIFPDTTRVIEVALEQFTDPGDAVVVDIPAYPGFLTAIHAAGRVPLRNELRLRDGVWDLDLAGLEKSFRAGATAYIFCNPHNPTGRVFPVRDLRRVLCLAAQAKATVIADEVFSPLVYPGSRHVPIGSLPEAFDVSTVTAVSASKAWNISGLRCGLAVPGRSSDFEVLMGMHPRDRDGASTLGVAATAAAFVDGGPWLRAATRYLYSNSMLLSSRLQALGSDVTYTLPEAGFLLWLDCRRLADRLGSVNPAQFFLHHAKVAVSDGEEFGAEGFIRMAFGTSRHLLVEIVERMRAGAKTCY